MSRQFPHYDPDGLLEYSVVFSDRSVNHMSQLFQQAMRDISVNLKQVYNAESIAIVPGGGSVGMESVARQFAHDRKCLVIRNGWFSYRWSQIFEMGAIPAECKVLSATQMQGGSQAPWRPADIDEVVETITREQPDLVFAPHVETASGMILPDDYLRRLAAAVHAHDGLFVLDCVASGSMWIDMQDIGVDVLVTAPQKGWSSAPCAALILLGSAATERLQSTTSSSFAIDLKKWRQIMKAYEDGGHAYHATMPTEGLIRLRDSINETLACGLEDLRQAHQQLGSNVRRMLADNGFPSVAAPGFEAPGVVVAYTTNPDISSARAFAENGIQAAAGVPLQCGEGADFQTFRVGLFGLDKLKDVDGTVQRLEAVIKRVAG